MSARAIELISRLLRVAPEQRYTICELRADPWLADGLARAERAAPPPSAWDATPTGRAVGAAGSPAPSQDSAWQRWRSPAMARSTAPAEAVLAAANDTEAWLPDMSPPSVRSSVSPFVSTQTTPKKRFSFPRRRPTRTGGFL